MDRNPDAVRKMEAAGFPQEAPFAEQARVLLAYAITAPSGHNTQPWMFEITQTGISVIADRRRALPVVDPHDRELVISCGAAIANLEIAAEQFGFHPSVMLAPDPHNDDLLAHVDLNATHSPNPKPGALFDAIMKRRTTRAHYFDDLPSSTLMATCIAHAQSCSVDLAFVSDEVTRRRVAELVDQGDHVQFDDPAFRRELASWVHSTRMGSRDGMSGASFGMPDIFAPVARFVMRTFDIGNGVAASDVKKIIEGSPTLALLSSPADDQAAWLQTGRALGRILLELTANGFTASYLNQPVETPVLRPKLKAEAGVSGWPQILLRVGVAAALPPATVRRPLEEVIA